MHNLDWIIVGFYMAATVLVGLGAGLRRWRGRGGSERSYFLADNTLSWPIIGLAMFAANISTVHLVSLAEAAYKYGLVFGNFEWMAGFTLLLLSLFFAPIYLRSRVATLPDFIERRYNRGCRTILSVVSLFSALVIHMGVALYTAAWVLRGILGLAPGATILGIDALYFFIIALGLVTGFYTMLGGLLAVVWTESIQAVLLLLGAVTITVVGLNEAGGWDAMAATLARGSHPLPGGADTSNFLHLFRGADDPSGLPWYSALLGYPVLGIWYWCCDQTIVQRVLAAKDEKHARLGPLFCAFLKIFPVFIFVLPGVICVALVQQGAFGGAAPASPADTYTFLIQHLLPTGLKGLVAAALLAAAMQTCSAALNSTATLVACDLVQRHAPQTTGEQLVLIGKITTAVGTLVAIVSSPLFGHYATIFEGINKLISYVAPPITAVFVLGVFWRGASGRAAYATLVSGIVLGGLVFLLDFTGTWRGDFMLTAFFLLVACLVIMVAGSRLMPESLKPEAEPLVWTQWRAPFGGPELRSVRWMAGAVMAAFVGLYFMFG